MGIVVSKISFQTMVFARNFGQKKAKISSLENSGNRVLMWTLAYNFLPFCDRKSNRMENRSELQIFNFEHGEGPL